MSTFRALTGPLGERDFELQERSTVEGALGYIREQPSLAMVVVEGVADSVSPDFVWMVRDLAGDLPVVWVAGESAPPPEFGLAEPRAVLTGVPTADEFARRANTLLSADYYPKSLLITLVSAANSVLATTFQSAVDVGMPWLKLSSLLPGEFNAFLPFLGKDSAGHVMVSGQRAHVLALGSDLGFEQDIETRVVVREVLGEIANQIVGRVKVDCGAYLPDLRLGLPLIISGRDMGISYPSARPCVTVQVGDDRGQLHVEFSFHRANVSADQSNLQDAGEVVLF